MARVRILFKGIVQGVGFRPFLYRSARKYNLAGFAKNTSGGVTLEVEGENIEGFTHYLLTNTPPLARIDNYETREIPREFPETFEILKSEDTGEKDLPVSPDIAICHQCKLEFSDPGNPRYKYPFINCTDCGPRFTIIRDLPYDRPKTTMKPFEMCTDCSTEYYDPGDRRFHAQPVSCFHCGPTLSYHGKGQKQSEDPLETAVNLLKDGHVVAIKGLGGYHLACKASTNTPVLRLRQLKRRERKPFALMGTPEMIRRYCRVSPEEEKHLLSPASPIVLLRIRTEAAISKYVAPGLNRIGFLAPYTPLHLLLLEKIGEPLVMTSANISDEPIIFRDHLRPLRALSDGVLRHNRKIQVFIDDSVMQVYEGKPYMVRRSRGFVPLPIHLPVETPKTILALGPMLKTTFTFLYGHKAIMGQYIGTTDSPSAIEAEKLAIDHYMNLFNLKPDVIAVDPHPEYPNRLIADEFPEAEQMEIQHHRAHVGSLLAERHELDRVIGIAMDGTGYGDDRNIWGGEFFVGNLHHLKRAGHLKYIFLPSGDQSIKEPWRFALSIRNALYGKSECTLQFAENFSDSGELLLEAIRRNIGGVLTSSCGRLFDAAACLIQIGSTNPYDGYLPMQLQAWAENCPHVYEEYPFSVETETAENGEKCYILNLLPMFHDLLTDNRDTCRKAFSFHYTLAMGFVKMADILGQEYGLNKVALTGGVFQNTLLLKLTKDLLEQEGFQVLIHSEVPPNDGGVSLGQAFLAAAKHIET